MLFCYTYRPLPYPVIIREAVDGNKCRNLHPNIVEREAKWGVSINFLPSEGRGRGKSGWRKLSTHSPLDQLNKAPLSSQRLTQQAQDYTGLCHVLCMYTIPSGLRMCWSLALLPSLGTLFLLLGCCIQLQYESFCFIFYSFLFLMIY